MKIVVASDSFKGCLNSREANQAAAEGVRDVYPKAEIAQVPVSDGGEGFTNACHAAIGGEQVEIMIKDPMMRTVKGKYLLHERMAVIEVAQACGLSLLAQEERNPLVATSYGVGQMVADAVRRGAMNVIIGLGGSATSDSGTGMLRALIDAFARNGQWDDIAELKQVKFTIAADVRNPLCGENGAAHVFAPQKGATPEMVLQLDERARKFAEVSARHFGFDRSEQEGAGAAGGLGYAFMQYLDAERKSGIELLLDIIHFEETVRDADLVITGEGSADRQTLMGKLPMGILKKAKGVPTCLIAGRISVRKELLEAGFAHVESINPPGLAQEEAMRKEVAQRNIRQTVGHILRKL